MEEKKLVRINTRISSVANDWLDEKSKVTGLSKSMLVMLAIEDYMKQDKAMSGIEEILVRLGEIENKVK